MVAVYKICNKYGPYVGAVFMSARYVVHTGLPKNCNDKLILAIFITRTILIF